MAADDATTTARRSAALRANATKGEAERRRAAKKAAWTRANGKDDAANPHTAAPAADGGVAGAFLYYWPRYRDDTARGPLPRRLNQNSAAMEAIVPGNTVWAFAPVAPGRNALVARFGVARTGENPPGSRARRDDGQWWFEADPGAAEYFDVERQPPVEPVIRGLEGVEARAAVLGHSFQGRAGVRRLGSAAARALEAHAAVLRGDDALPGDSPLAPEEADAEPFDPSDLEDARATVARQVKARRGQREFRDKLLAAYGGRCAITGCRVPDVLEAAHIHPYRGAETNHVANGLLLRADLHTLLDCGLLAIDPDGLRLVVAPSVRASPYGKLHGRALRPREAGWPGPSTEALRLRFDEFTGRHGR